MTVDQLEVLTVSEIPLSASRVAIFAEFRRLYTDLLAFGLLGELWVNGSFLTSKVEPDDIDLSFTSPVEHLDIQVPEVWPLLTAINGNKSYSRLIDSYVFYTFTPDDPRRLSARDDYWAEKWGVGWDDYLKGFAVVTLGEPPIGRRWRRVYT